MRTAEMKSNEKWSSQLRTQLLKKPEKKIQVFNGIWTCDFVERDMSSDLFHGNMN